jgi:DNA repair exonuclease SbcCD ATPase subunit
MSTSAELWLGVLTGERRGARFPLDRPLTIGSNRESGLHLRDAAVSWRHARLFREGDELVIEDQGSANGTAINGAVVQRSRLREGDRILVGATELAVLAAGEALPAAGSLPAAPRPSPGAELAERLRQSEAEIAVLRDEVSAARSACAGLERDKEAFAGERDAAQRSGEESRKALDALREELGGMERQNRSQRADRGRLARDLETLQEAHRGALGVLEEKNAQMEVLRRDLETSQLESTSLRRDLAAATAALQAERAAAAARQVDGDRTAAGLQHEIGRERLDADALRQSLRQAGEQHAALRESLLAAERKLAATAGELDGLRSAHQRLVEERERLDRVVREEREQSQAARLDLEQRLRVELGAREEASRRHQSELEALHRDLRAELVAVEERSRRELEALVAEHRSALKSQGETLLGRAQEAEDRAQAAENDVRALKERCRVLSDDLDAAQAAHSRAEEALRSLREESRTLQDAIERASAERDELRGLAAGHARLLAEGRVEHARLLAAAREECDALRTQSAEIERRSAEQRDALAESAALLSRAEDLRQADLRALEDLRAGEARLSTEAALLRDYVEELRRKAAEKDDELRDLRRRLRHAIRAEPQVLPQLSAERPDAAEAVPGAADTAPRDTAPRDTAPRDTGPRDTGHAAIALPRSASMARRSTKDSRRKLA